MTQTAVLFQRTSALQHCSHTHWAIFTVTVGWKALYVRLSDLVSSLNLGCCIQMNLAHRLLCLSLTWG